MENEDVDVIEKVLSNESELSIYVPHAGCTMENEDVNVDVDVIEKVVSNEPELPIYVPYAGYTTPGIASFKDTDFHVEPNGQVQLSKEIYDIRDEAQAAADMAKEKSVIAEKSAHDALVYQTKTVELADAANDSATNAKISATNAKMSEINAKASADEAANAAEALKNVSARTVKFVPELPETGDSEYIYAVVSESDINLFELWAWVDGVLTYFGSATIVTDIDNVYIRTLPQDGWENNSQIVEIAEVNTDKKVIVMPLDMSAATYIKCDVVPTLVQGGVTFSCERIPDEDINVIIQVTVKNEVKNFAGYYTKAQVDSYLSKKQDMSDSSLQTTDKTVVGAINENAVAIDGLRRDIIDEAHFRGYFKTNADVQSAPGNANDYAWSAESGTVWIYGVGGWGNSGAPIPDKTVPPSTTTPIMDGTAAVGSSTNYARADHVHPSDTKKANAADLNAEMSNRETADVQLSEKIENVYRSANVVLRVEGWSNHQQIIDLPQVSATSGVIVYPDDASSAAYVLADIYFTQINGQIVFACVNTPTENINITVETFN